MKYFLILFVAVVFFSQLFAQHGGGDFDLLIKYQKEPTQENLDTALNYYHKLLESENKEMAQIALANIHMMAMNKVLMEMQDNLESLSMRSQFQLANILLENNRFEESIAIYDIINSSSPKWSCAWRHKGEAFLKLNRLEDAEIATIKAIKTREDHYDAYIQLAEVQKEMGNYETALETLEKGSEYAASYTEDEIEAEDVKALRDEIEKLLDNE